MAHCLLIDGNNIVFRAFYAFGNQRLKTRDGLQTGAVYGFVRMLTKILKDKKPDLVAVAFDTSRNTFRKKRSRTIDRKKSCCKRQRSCAILYISLDKS